MFFYRKKKKYTSKLNEIFSSPTKNNRIIPVRTLEARMVFDGAFSDVFIPDLLENADEALEETIINAKDKEKSASSNESKQSSNVAFEKNNTKQKNFVSKKLEIKNRIRGNKDAYHPLSLHPEAAKDKPISSEGNDTGDMSSAHFDLEFAEGMYPESPKEIEIEGNSKYYFNEHDFNLLDKETLAEIILMSLPESGDLRLEGRKVATGESILASKISQLNFTPELEADRDANHFLKFRIRNSENKSIPSIISIYTINMKVKGESKSYPPSIEASRNLLKNGECSGGVSSGWIRKAPTSSWAKEGLKNFYNFTKDDAYKGGVYNVLPSNGGGVCGIESDNFSSEDASIYQVIETDPGQRYMLSLDVISDANNIRDLGSLFIGGKKVHTFTASDKWERVSFLFEADSYETEIQIQAEGSEGGRFSQKNDGRGLLVSNVRVESQYIEDTPAIKLLEKVSISREHGSRILKSAVVRLINGKKGDRLLFDGLSEDSGSISFVRAKIDWAWKNNEIVFNGITASGCYEEVLYRIGFKHEGDNPEDRIRNIGIVVYDAGGVASPEEIIEIKVIPVQDKPIIYDDEAQAFRNQTLREDKLNGLLANDKDPDDDKLELVRFSLNATEEIFLAGERARIGDSDFLTINPDGSYVFEVGEPYAGEKTVEIKYFVTDGSFEESGNLKIQVKDPNETSFWGGVKYFLSHFINSFWKETLPKAQENSLLLEKTQAEYKAHLEEEKIKSEENAQKLIELEKKSVKSNCMNQEKLNNLSESMDSASGVYIEYTKKVLIGLDNKYKFNQTDFDIDYNYNNNPTDILIKSTPESGGLKFKGNEVVKDQYIPVSELDHLIFTAPSEANLLEKYSFEFLMRGIRNDLDQNRSLLIDPVYTMIISNAHTSPIVEVVPNLLRNGKCSGGISDGWVRESFKEGWVDAEDKKNFYRKTEQTDIHSGGFYKIAPPNRSGVCGIEDNHLSPEASLIKQTIKTTPGQSYLLSLHAISDALNIKDRGTIWINGKMVHEFLAFEKWIPVRVLFNPDSYETEIEIQAEGSEGGLFPHKNDGRGLLISNLYVKPVYNKQDGKPISIGEGIRITTHFEEPKIFESATIRLVNKKDGDRLLVDSSSDDSGKVLISWSRIDWVRKDEEVLLRGLGTVEQYTKALYLIGFENKADVTEQEARAVEITISDGIQNSIPAFTIIGIAAEAYNDLICETQSELSEKTEEVESKIHLNLTRNILKNGKCLSSEGWSRSSGKDPRVGVDGGGVYNNPLEDSGICGIENDDLSSEPSSLRQTLKTIAGQTYSFSLDAISDLNNAMEWGTLWVDGKMIHKFRVSSKWTTINTTFDAVSEKTDIWIQAEGSDEGQFKEKNDGHGLLISNMYVEPVYQENESPIKVFENIEIKGSPENNILRSATITLSDWEKGDRFVVNGFSESSGFIRFPRARINWTRTDNQVVFYGVGTIAQYTEALYSLGFEHTGKESGDTERKIIVVVSDSKGQSSTGFMGIKIAKDLRSKDANHIYQNDIEIRNITENPKDIRRDKKAELIGDRVQNFSGGAVDSKNSREDNKIQIHDDVVEVLQDKMIQVDKGKGLLSKNQSNDEPDLSIVRFKVNDTKTEFNCGQRAQIEGLGFLTINSDGSYIFEPGDEPTEKALKVTYFVNNGSFEESRNLKIEIKTPDKLIASKTKSYFSPRLHFVSLGEEGKSDESEKILETIKNSTETDVLSDDPFVMQSNDSTKQIDQLSNKEQDKKLYRKARDVSDETIFLSNPESSKSVSYTENKGAMVFLPNIVLNYKDSLNITVNVTVNNFQPEDRLYYAGETTTDANKKIRIKGKDIIVTRVGNQVKFNGLGSAADYESALRLIKFRAEGERPSTIERLVEIQVSYGNSVVSESAVLNVIQVEDIPILSVGNSFLNWVKGNQPIYIAPDINITDKDDTLLVGAEVKLANNATGNQLFFEGTLDNQGKIEGTNITINKRSNDSIIFDGVSSIENYQAALRWVKFSGTNHTSQPGERLISIEAKDGKSEPIPQVIHVMVEDRILIENLQAEPLSYAEGSSPLVIASGVRVSVKGNGNLSYAEVALLGAQLGDRLSYNGELNDQNMIPQTSIGVRIEESETKIVFEGSGTGEQYSLALQAVLFDNLEKNPSVGNRTLAISADDALEEAKKEVVIEITAINDAPVIEVDSIATWNKDAGPVRVSNINISDPDSFSFILAEVSLSENQSGDRLFYRGEIDDQGMIPETSIHIKMEQNPVKVVFEGQGSKGEYERALGAVIFDTDKDNVLAVQRKITFSINDGDKEGTKETFLDVVAVKKSPIIKIDYPIKIWKKGNPAEKIATVHISDYEGPNLSLASALLKKIDNSDALYYEGEIDDQGMIPETSIRVEISSDRSSVSFKGQDTAEKYALALSSVSFKTSEDSSSGNRRVLFTTRDDSQNNASKQLIISVIQKDTNGMPPVLKLDKRVVEWRYGDTPVKIVPDIEITDKHSPTLSWAEVSFSEIFNNYRFEYSELVDSSGFIPGTSIRVTKTIGTMHFEGIDTAEKYASALRSVVFERAGRPPEDRTENSLTVLVTVSNGNNQTKEELFLRVLENSPPAISTDNQIATWKEGHGPIKIGKITIEDPDSQNLQNAYVYGKSLRGGNLSYGGQLDENRFIPGTSIRVKRNYTGATISFEGSGTLSQYMSAINSVVFDNISQSIKDGAGKILISVNDGINKEELETIVDVVSSVSIPINEKVLVNLGDKIATWIKGDPATRFMRDISISNDKNILWANVILPTEETGGRLGYIGTIDDKGLIPGTSIRVEINPDRRQVNLTGEGTPEQYALALKSVVFENTDDELVKGIHAVSLFLGGDELERAAVIPIKIVTDRNAPTLRLNESIVGWEPGTAPIRVASGITISDSDGFQLFSAQANLKLAWLGDRLVYTGPLENGYIAGTNIRVITQADNNKLSFKGFGTAEQYILALESVIFETGIGSPVVSGSRVVSLSVSDGELEGRADVSVNVIAKHKAPVVSLSSDRVEWDEVSSAPVRVGIGLTISGADSQPMSYGKASLEGAKAGDRLSFIDRVDENGYIAGTNIRVVMGEGNLSVEFIGSEGSAEYERAFGSVIFETGIGSPVVSGSRVVSLSVSDGELEGRADVSVNVIAKHKAPVVSLSSDRVEWDEVSAAPVRVGIGLTISGADSQPMSYGKASLEGAKAGDRLSFIDRVDENGYIAGTKIRVVMGEGNLSVEFIGSEGSAEYERAFGSVIFETGIGSPVVSGSRVVSLSVSDGELEGRADVSVNVIAKHKAPVVSLSSDRVEWDEVSAAPVRVGIGLTISGADSQPMSYGKASLEGAKAGDRLSFIDRVDENGYIAGTKIRVVMGEGNLSVEFIGSEGSAEYERALGSVIFETGIGSPVVSGSRVVSLSVGDGELEGRADVSVNVIGRNASIIPIVVQPALPKPQFIKEIQDLTKQYFFDGGHESRKSLRPHETAYDLMKLIEIKGSYHEKNNTKGFHSCNSCNYFNIHTVKIDKRIYLIIGQKNKPLQDDQNIDYSVSMANGSPLPKWFKKISSGYFSGIPDYLHKGSHKIDLVVSITKPGEELVQEFVQLNAITGEVLPVKKEKISEAKKENNQTFSEQIRIGSIGSIDHALMEKALGLQ